MTPTSIRLPDELMEKLENHAKLTKISRSKLIQNIIENYFHEKDQGIEKILENIEQKLDHQPPENGEIITDLLNESISLKEEVKFTKAVLVVMANADPRVKSTLSNMFPDYF